MSILGHYNNFFFAAHLLDIAMGVKTLRTILSSVTHNGKQVSLIQQGVAVVQLYTIYFWYDENTFFIWTADVDRWPPGGRGLPVHSGGF